MHTNNPLHLFGFKIRPSFHFPAKKASGMQLKSVNFSTKKEQRKRRQNPLIFPNDNGNTAPNIHTKSNALSTKFKRSKIAKFYNMIVRL
jgi:hypothetical protein